MKLTTKGRYAVTAMVDLALHNHTGQPVPLSEIAERQCMSLAYLEQLFGKLRRAGLVLSARGPGGGYRLARPAEALNVAEIIAAVDERVDATRCSGARNCRGNNDGPCLTHALWSNLNHRIQQYLSSVSLQEIAEQSLQDEVLSEGTPMVALKDLDSRVFSS